MKYIKIYEFQAMDKIREGKEVLMLDRKFNEVNSVNFMFVGVLAEIINEKNEDNRYEFWYAEEEEENV